MVETQLLRFIHELRGQRSHLVCAPRRKRSDPTRLTRGAAFREELAESGQREPGEAGALVDSGISLIDLEYHDRERPSIIAPDFGNSDSGINSQPVENGAGNLDLDSDVRRRVVLEVDFFFSTYQKFVLDPVTFVGFEPFFL